MRTASRITMGSPFFSVFLASGPPAGSLRYIALIYAAPFRACASPRPLYYRPVSPRLLLFERFHDREILFAGEITSEDALSVRGRHQVGIGYAAKATSTARTVVDAGSEPIEVVIDVLDSAEIVFRERKAVLFGQMLLDGFEIFRIEHIADRRVFECGEDLLNGRFGTES